MKRVILLVALLTVVSSTAAADPCTNIYCCNDRYIACYLSCAAYGPPTPWCEDACQSEASRCWNCVQSNGVDDPMICPPDIQV